MRQSWGYRRLSVILGLLNKMEWFREHLTKSLLDSKVFSSLEMMTRLKESGIASPKLASYVPSLSITSRKCLNSRRIDGGIKWLGLIRD